MESVKHIFIVIIFLTICSTNSNALELTFEGRFDNIHSYQYYYNSSSELLNDEWIDVDQDFSISINLPINEIFHEPVSDLFFLDDYTSQYDSMNFSRLTLLQNFEMMMLRYYETHNHDDYDNQIFFGHYLDIGVPQIYEYNGISGIYDLIGVSNAFSYNETSYMISDYLRDGTGGANSDNQDAIMTRQDLVASLTLISVVESEFDSPFIDPPLPSPAPVPEPSTLLLFASGLVGLGIYSRRKKS